jgi:iron complex outermembrane receptor protein
MQRILKLTFLIGVVLAPLFLSAQNSPIVNATISGKVVDARTNEALIGATVTIKGTTNGAATDANGDFNLVTGQKLPFTLIVSYVGYVKKEVLINESKVVIKLDANTTQLEDVVISSRRRQESAQDVPIPISVIGGQGPKMPVL